MLKYKSQQVMASEKKLSNLINKRSEVRAQKAKTVVKNINHHKECLSQEMDVLVASNEAKYGIERLKKVSLLIYYKFSLKSENKKYEGKVSLNTSYFFCLLKIQS